MFHVSDKITEFDSNKEKPLRKVLVEFNQAEHYNALITEPYCPIELAREPECIKQIIINCETDEEALKVSKHHYFLTGSNFKILN